MIKNYFLGILLSTNLVTVAQSSKLFKGTQLMGNFGHKVNFRTEIPTVNYKVPFKVGFFFGAGQSSISDSFGNLLLSSQGFQLYDSNFALIENGDSIGGGAFMEYEYGFSAYSQSSILLPFHGNKYYFVNGIASDSTWTNICKAPNPVACPYDKLLYSKIEQVGNGYRVTKKAIELNQTDEWYSKTQMMACKHANGKDWWLLKKAYYEHSLYVYLFTEDSVYVKGKVALPWAFCDRRDNMGMITFSPDGSEFCFTQNNFCNEVFRCSFDRTNGSIAPIEILKAPNVLTGEASYPEDNTTVGLAYSPNGQLLYLTRYMGVMQYDFKDNNANTKWYQVCALDTTYVAFAGYNAPYLQYDGKIYLGSWHATSSTMSRIDNPDVKGIGCNFCRKCLQSDYQVSIFNSPPCQPNYAMLALPTMPKINENELVVYPNPAHQQINIYSNYKEPGRLDFYLYNALGAVVKKIQCEGCYQKTTMNLDDIASGIYLYKAYWNKKLVLTGKLNVIE